LIEASRRYPRHTRLLSFYRVSFVVLIIVCIFYSYSFIAGTVVIQLVEITTDEATLSMPSSPSLFEVAAPLLLVFVKILPRDKLS
jgi:hypothetical protein